MKRAILLLLASLLVVSCGISAYPTFNDSPTDLAVYRERNKLKSENARLQKRIEELEEALRRLAKQNSSGSYYAASTTMSKVSTSASSTTSTKSRPDLDQTREVHVSGHYRTVNGKKVWVRPHTRSRPGYKKR